MSAPANIPAIELLAAQIITGDYSGLPVVDHETYTKDEWQDAAQYALDGDDFDLKYMLRREVALDAHNDACRTYERRTGRDWDNSTSLCDPDAWIARNFPAAPVGVAA